MSSMRLIQNAFNGGVLSPKMDARSDQTRYTSGMRIGKNGWLFPHGSFDRRPGLRFIAECGNHAKAQKLTSFEYNKEQAYAVECGIHTDGTGYMRFFKEKAQIWIPDTDAAIDNAQWTDKSGAGCSTAVSGTEISLTCDGQGEKAWAEQAVTHTSDGLLHSMTFHVANGPVTLRVGTTSQGDEVVKDVVKKTGYHTVSFTVPLNETTTYIQFFYGLGAETKKVQNVKLSDNNAVEIPSPFTTEQQLREFKLCQSADVAYIVHPTIKPHKLMRYGHTEWAMVEAALGPSLDPPTGLQASAKGATGSNKYSYVVTAVTEHDEESLRSAAVEITNGHKTLSDDNYVELSWSAVPEATQYNIYRLKNGLDSYIGKSGDTLFHDVGEKEPNEDENPPIERNPFEEEDSYPEAITFHEQRLTFGRGLQVEMSQTAIPENMNKSVPLKDDDAVSFKLVADKRNDIVWMASGKKLFIGTTGGVWSVQGDDGNKPITPASPNPNRESVRGCASLPPLIIGNSLLFVQRPGKIIRELKYTLEDDGYNTNDVSILSEHLVGEDSLLGGRRIVDWCFQQAPLSTVWMVLEDGAFLGLAYNREHEVVGWVEQETDGTVESCCTIPGPDEDELWITVRRYVNGQWKRYVECLDTLFRDEKLDKAFYIDSGLTYDNPLMIEDIVMGNPVTVQVAAGHEIQNGDYVRLTGVLSREVVKATKGYAGREGYKSHDDLNDKRYKVANVTETTFQLQDSRGNSIDGTKYPARFQGGEVRKCVTKLTNLNHLEGKEVQILADGAVHPEKVVTNGEVVLDKPRSHVHIGLPYRSVLMPMKPEATTQDGTIQGQVKRITDSWARVYRSLGVKIGPNEDKLQSAKSRNDKTPGGMALTAKTEDLKIDFDSGYDVDAEFLIVQDQPLPMSVVALIMELEVD